MDDDEPDPDRRALLGILAALPVIGGGFELASRLFIRTAERETARASARAILSPETRRDFPFAKAAESLPTRPDDRQDHERP